MQVLTLFRCRCDTARFSWSCTGSFCYWQQDPAHSESERTGSSHSWGSVLSHQEGRCHPQTSGAQPQGPFHYCMLYLISEVQTKDAGCIQQHASLVCICLSILPHSKCSVWKSSVHFICLSLISLRYITLLIRVWTLISNVMYLHLECILWREVVL